MSTPQPLAKIELRSPTSPVPPPILPDTPSDRARARFSLDGKCAIVTGGSGGLGLSVSHALLEHGLSALYIFDLHPPPTETYSELVSLYKNVHFIHVDVTDEAQVAEAVKGAGAVDVLVHCAGIVGVVNSLEMPVERWRRVIDVNMTGSFICARAVAKSMVATSTRGSIILTASISAHTTNFPQPQAAYNVSKAGVLHLARDLAVEYARYGIRVNSISPGYLDTVLNEGDHLEEARRVWNERTPMGRMGSTEEVLGAVVFLASGAGSFMTGSDVRVDGGYTLL